jgi:AhpD family alkylhydroperoxidase
MVAELGRSSPGTVRGTGSSATLAVAVTRQCDGCIVIHAGAALKHGATRDEIAEALGVAIAVNAGAALVSSTRAMDAYDAKAAPSARAAP